MSEIFNDDVEVNGNLQVGGWISTDIGFKVTDFIANNITIETDLLVTGDAVIQGDLTYQNVTNSNVTDNELVLNYSDPGVSQNSSIFVRRTKVSTEGDNDAQIIWDESTDQWKMGIVGDVSPVLTAHTNKIAGQFYTDTAAPSNNDVLKYDGYFYATRVYNAVYNDFADFQELADENIEYGKAYVATQEGLTKATSRCQKGIVGIASNTYGMSVGNIPNMRQVPIAVSGWVLTHVDKKYEIGTPLVNTKDGILTKASLFERLFKSERIVGIFARVQEKNIWNKVQVNNRHWVKVK